MKRQPKPIAESLKDSFTPEAMGPGMKRGFVLRIYKAKIAEAAGKNVAALVDGAKMKGTYENPDLHIFCSNEMVRHELHLRRVKIREKINQRMKSEFINKVVVR